MSGRVQRGGLAALLLAGLCGPALHPPLQADETPTSLPLTKRFKFPDEREIKKDWKLSGDWRVEGQGLRLYGEKTTELESKYRFRGDLELQIEFEISPRRELCVGLWGELFEFKPEVKKTPKGNILAVGRLVRRGDDVKFHVGNDAWTTVKVHESRRDSATPLVIHLDRKTSSRSARELLLRSVTVKAAHAERPADE